MTDITTAAPSRSIRLLAAASAAVVITALTLAPPGVVGPARGAFMRLLHAANEPLLASIPSGDADQLLNTILFVPLGATIALLLSRRAWLVAILGGLALSVAVEYAQISIPGRVPDPADVLWNTVGGAIGVTVMTVPRLAAAASCARKHQRGRATRT